MVQPSLQSTLSTKEQLKAEPGKETYSYGHLETVEDTKITVTVMAILILFIQVRYYHFFIKLNILFSFNQFNITK